MKHFFLANSIMVFILLAICTSCSKIGEVYSSDGWVSRFPGERLAIRRIEGLKRELLSAQHSQQVAKERSIYLQRYLIRKEMDFIKNRADAERKQLDKIRKKNSYYRKHIDKDLSDFFLYEREVLVHIIDTKEEFVEEAQVLLNKILKLITDLNESLE